MKKHIRHMTPRSFLPLVIAGVFALVLLVALALYLFDRAPPPGPSQAELAADYAQGEKYERGDGVTLDYSKALDLYRKAADGGYPQAELALGLIYMNGRGVVADPKQAAQWFGKAAEQGLAEAQVQYAGDLLSGAGTADGKPDRIEAMKWLLIGANAVTDPLMKQVAINTRDSLANELSPDDRNQAQQRADDWTKQHPPVQ